MPDLNQLLHRAAELAPEWCEDVSASDRVAEYSLKSMGVVVEPSFDETAEMDRALILFSVLKECERRGLRYTLDRWNARIIMSNGMVAHGNGPPEESMLGAFIAYLETEVKAEPFGASE